MTPRAWVALATVYVVWGSTFLGIALAGETIPPLFAAAVRFTIVGALMAGWVIARHGTQRFREGRRPWAEAVFTGLLLIGSNAVLFVAERDVPIGLASLIIASVPLWIVLLRAVTGDRPKAGAIAGAVIGFAGVALLIRPSGQAGVGALLLVLGSAVMWALGTFLSTRMRMFEDTVTTVSVQAFAGGVFLLPLGLLLRDGESLDPSSWSSRSIFGLVYLIFVGSLVGYTTYVWLLGHVPLGTVATYAYVNPIVAIALGVIVLDETVTWTIVGGAAVVLAGVALVISRESRDAIEPFPE